MLAFELFANAQEWREVREREDERFNEEYGVRLDSTALAAKAGFNAMCGACGVRGAFLVDARLDGYDEAHREQMRCPSCRLPGRVRAAWAVLEAEALPRDAEIYITEHGTPAWQRLRQRFPGLVGSEFDPERRSWPRRLRHAWRFGSVAHEDLRRLSFSAARFDGVVCMEVFEHIDAVDDALRECARVLRPGGVLVATAPFDENAVDDVRMALEQEDGSLEWLGAEEWHADPLGGRVPCFHRFGWGVLDRVRAAGFTDAHWCRVQARDEALFGLWVLRARR